MTLQLKMNEFDNRTSAELAAESFSGIRTNDIMSRFEIWIAGQMDRTLTYERFWREPHSLETVYCEAFGLKKVTLSGAVAEAIREIAGRKRGIAEMEDTEEGRRILDNTGRKIED